MILYPILPQFGYSFADVVRVGIVAAVSTRIGRLTSLLVQFRTCRIVPYMGKRIIEPKGIPMTKSKSTPISDAIQAEQWELAMRLVEACDGNFTMVRAKITRLEQFVNSIKCNSECETSKTTSSVYENFEENVFYTALPIQSDSASQLRNCTL